MPKEKSKHFKLPLNKSNQRNIQQFLTPFQRHQQILQPILSTTQPTLSTTHTSELQLLKQHHKFLNDGQSDSWEQRLSLKYYEKLFKEYCLVNLTRYKQSQIAMRWRTKQEVINGKGQFSCASLDCKNTNNLFSFEVNFKYVEPTTIDGNIINQSKNALVKVRLCQECGEKLHYKKKSKLYSPADTNSNLNIQPQSDKPIPLEIPDDDDNNTSDNIWSKSLNDKEHVELTQDQEFDAYFADLLA